MARQLVTGQQCGQRCAPKWDKIQRDSKSLAVAPGLRAPVAVTLLSCIEDEALYWQWAEDVFEVMNSGTQTHNISGRILSRLVYSQGLLCWIKQIHLRSPEAKPSCFLHVPCFCSNANTACTFSDLKILCAVNSAQKCCSSDVTLGMSLEWCSVPVLHISSIPGTIHFVIYIYWNVKQSRGNTRICLILLCQATLLFHRTSAKQSSAQLRFVIG